MNRYVAKAKKIVEDNIYLTIATAGLDCNPWISPVFFVYDSDYNFYWISNKDSKHSRYIRENPKISIVIFNSQATEGKGDGVYVEALAEELGAEDQIIKVSKLWNQRATEEDFKVKSIEQVTSGGVWRIYKACPNKIYTLSEGELVNGQYVDKRVEIKFE